MKNNLVVSPVRRVFRILCQLNFTGPCNRAVVPKNGSRVETGPGSNSVPDASSAPWHSTYQHTAI